MEDQGERLGKVLEMAKVRINANLEGIFQAHCVYYLI